MKTSMFAITLIICVASANANLRGQYNGGRRVKLTSGDPRWTAPREDGRCGPRFGFASCDPMSEAPCCNYQKKVAMCGSGHSFCNTVGPRVDFRTIVEPKPTKPRKCCRAKKLRCMACAAGMSPKEYCAEYPDRRVCAGWKPATPKPTPEQPIDVLPKEDNKKCGDRPAWAGACNRCTCIGGQWACTKMGCVGPETKPEGAPELEEASPEEEEEEEADADTTENAEPDHMTDFSKYPTPKLRQLLKRMGLRVQGNRKALLARIAQAIKRRTEKGLDPFKKPSGGGYTKRPHSGYKPKGKGRVDLKSICQKTGNDMALRILCGKQSYAGVTRPKYYQG